MRIRKKNFSVMTYHYCLENVDIPLKNKPNCLSKKRSFKSINLLSMLPKILGIEMNHRQLDRDIS